ncbi:urea transport system substrate-binding protein [Nocardioides aromaticivorans]|uniref:Urea transport system substrate-binding protein n=1 Tax=Nocardioides aromaticivorans TaxID=200618 RepID=A0A7Y9ZPG5_9ACTN|nr:urea ABC transporter substrate-binding protein [Nocardioides aromaticivorans]NYI47321.1 urea transport system substrate-binding protein [Nocardioides aromaticivorans]
MFHSRSRLATGSVLVLTAALSLSACGGSKSGESSSAESCVDTSGDTIKLGFLNSTSGAMAISEQTVRDSLVMALEEINADGGILGKKIEPVVEDGASDPAVFAEKIEKLLTGDCVAAVFGGWTSASRKAMLPVVEADNGLLFYPVQYEGLEASKNIYYTGATTNQQIIPAMDFLKSKGVKTLFLAGSDYVFPRTANKIIKQYAKELGIEIVGEEYVPLDDDDWTTQVSKIVKAKPDFVFNTINGSSNVGFIKAYYEQGLSPETSPIISVSIAEEEAPAMGKDVTGQFAAWNYFQSVKSPTNDAFIKAFKAKYGDKRPTSDPMEAAYTSLYLYKALVEKADSFDVDKINAAADGVTFDAPEGTVTIDGENHHIAKTGLIGRINKDNQFDVVWSSDAPIEPDPFLKGYSWWDPSGE